MLRLFQPDRDPGEIKAKRTYIRRTRYFARNELSRLCMDALREADGALLTTDEIAGRIIEAKAFDAADATLRKAIGEEIGGHISPLGAYDAKADRFLILDVARYKYPPVWVKTGEIFDAMNTPDASNGDKTRGFVLVTAAAVH